MGQTSLEQILEWRGQSSAAAALDLFKEPKKKETQLYFEGNLDLIKKPSIAIIGSREVGRQHLETARTITADLVQADLVIVSGLAKGIDATAHRSAIEHGGSTIAVIGTPLDVVYPAAHRELQREIADYHLVVSQFASGTKTYPSNFPRRNKVMAAVSSASLVIQAAEGSGTLHQLDECKRLKRPILIFEQIIADGHLWTQKYLQLPFTHVVSSGKDIARALNV